MHLLGQGIKKITCKYQNNTKFQVEVQLTVTREKLNLQVDNMTVIY